MRPHIFQTAVFLQTKVNICHNSILDNLDADRKITCFARITLLRSPDIKNWCCKSRFHFPELCNCARWYLYLFERSIQMRKPTRMLLVCELLFSLRLPCSKVTAKQAALGSIQKVSHHKSLKAFPLSIYVMSWFLPHSGPFHDFSHQCSTALSLGPSEWTCVAPERLHAIPPWYFSPPSSLCTPWPLYLLLAN